MLKENPNNKEGPRDVDCCHYNECLTYAARSNWKYFSCEDCPFFKSNNVESPITTGIKDKKVCKKCDKRPANKAWETKKIAKRNASIIKEIEALIGKPYTNLQHIENIGGQ